MDTAKAELEKEIKRMPENQLDAIRQQERIRELQDKIRRLLFSRD